jgi:hypothetical protein
VLRVVQTVESLQGTNQTDDSCIQDHATRVPEPVEAPRSKP